LDIQVVFGIIMAGLIMATFIFGIVLYARGDRRAVKDD
jgi:hypothetical protein